MVNRLTHQDEAISRVAWRVELRGVDLKDYHGVMVLFQRFFFGHGGMD